MKDEIKEVIDTIINNIKNDRQLAETYLNFKKIAVNTSNIAIISHNLSLLDNVNANQEAENLTRESEKILKLLADDDFDAGRTIELFLIIIGAIIEKDETINEVAEYMVDQLSDVIPK